MAKVMLALEGYHGGEWHLKQTYDPRNRMSRDAALEHLARCEEECGAGTGRLRMWQRVPGDLTVILMEHLMEKGA